MFIKSLKANILENNFQTCPDSEVVKTNKYTAKRHLVRNPQDARKKSWFKIKMEKAHPLRQEKIVKNNNTLFSFENQYLKQLVKEKEESQINQRKLEIKQKIKGRVKQQLADLIKRSEFTSNSMISFRKKDQSVIQNTSLIHNVSVQGSSIKNRINLRTESGQKKRFESSLKNIKKRSSMVSVKPSTADNTPKSTGKKGTRRSLSSAIRHHKLENKKPQVRNIHSALSDIRRTNFMMQSSGQIEPWEYNQQF